MSKVRHYCATFWKKPEIKIEDKVRYAIYGEEICPDTGKVHWQSYMEFYNPQRMAAVKKIYDDKTVHIEERRGTREEAKAYCMKDGKFTEYGKWIKGQGHRSDLDDIVTMLKEGQRLSEVALDNPAVYCQYRNGLKDIAATITKNKTKEFRKVDVTLISGPTGVGKTRSAMEAAGDDVYKITGNDLNWWQDYDGEESIVIDDYDNDVNITKMLNILDGYQLRLNVKGSHTYANWTKVFITTNLRIYEIHSQAKPAHRDALLRRVTKIVNLWDKEVQGNTDLDLEDKWKKKLVDKTNPLIMHIQSEGISARAPSCGLPP